MSKVNSTETWFTSDLHFGHKNIIRFCDRPFKDYGSLDEQRLNSVSDSQVEKMNEAILYNINSKVGQEDELWILGDIAMGNIDYTLKLVEKIICSNITIVAGNHDRCHPVNGEKYVKWVERYEELHNVKSLYLENTIFTFPNTDVTVQVSHFPYGSFDNSYTPRAEDVESKKDRYEKWRPTDNGEWLLCGHVHEKWRQKDKQINVGIDAWGGSPVSAKQLLSLIDAGENNIPRIHWTR
jgi:calcineurin-like phosphoesterase family protein